MRENVEHNRKGSHCHNCKHLEWGEGDVGDPSGWVCTARDYDCLEQESLHFAQLDNEQYRFKGKRCFESKR